LENTISRQQVYKLIISGILCIWTLSIFLPGSYSIDSWNQWNEVKNGSYDDWYGTGLATTWKYLWKFTGNYMCLYVVQMCFYWTFVTMLLWRINFKTIGYWITLGFALFFCFIAQYVMRDALTVLAWGMALVLLIEAGQSQSHRKSLTILSMLLLAYGLWVRVNALVAFLPLAYVGIILLGGQRLAVWKRVLIAGASCIFLFVAIHEWTYRVQKAARLYPEYKLKLLDLSGITKLSGENQFPPVLTSYSGFHLDTILSQYTPASVDDLYWPANGIRIWPHPNDSINRIVTHSWISAIRHHPIYYLENRFEGFLYYLHIKRRFPVGQYWDVVIFWIQPDGPLPAKLEPSPVKDKIGKMYGYFDKYPLYDAWFWLMLNIAGFVWFTRNYFKRPKTENLFWLTHACIQLSGVLFILSQVLIYQHDRDFRYTYWNVYVTLFALAGAFASQRQGTGVKPAP
jgi:hypothetical protein